MQGNKILGYANENDYTVDTAEAILELLKDKSLKKATQANLFILSPCVPSVPSFMSRISPVWKGQSSDTVADWFGIVHTTAKQAGLSVIGLGADGDSKVRKFNNNPESTNRVTIQHPGFDYSIVLYGNGNSSPVFFCFFF